MNLKYIFSLLLFIWVTVLTTVAQSVYTTKEFPVEKRRAVKQYAKNCLENYYNTIGDALFDFETLLRFQDVYLSSNTDAYQPELLAGKAEHYSPRNLNAYLLSIKEAYNTADMESVTFTPEQVVFEDIIYKTEDNDKGCILEAEYILSVAEDDKTFARRKCKGLFYIENVLRPMEIKIHGIKVVADLEVVPHTLKVVRSNNPLAYMTDDELMAHSASYDDFINEKAVVTDDNAMYFKELAFRNHWRYALMLSDYYYRQGETTLMLGCLRWNAVREEGVYIEPLIAHLGSILLNEGRLIDGVFWSRKAAQNGSPVAQFNLGRSYMLGYGVNEDLYEAFSWLLKAAEQDYTEAQIMVAIIYRMKEGPVPADFKKSFEWMQKAAAQNDGHAWYRLAEYYKEGVGTDKDEAKVKECFYKGALAGNVDAQFEYGMIEYDNKNYIEALPWLVNAAEQGQHKAQFILGVMYREGYGVSKDNEKANEWFAKAAEED